MAVVLGERRFKPAAKKVVAVVQQQGHWVEVLMVVMAELTQALAAAVVVAAQVGHPQLLVLRQRVIMAALEANLQAAMREALGQVCRALTVLVAAEVLMPLLQLTAEAMAALYLHGHLEV
jgi:hypothetical protein